MNRYQRIKQLDVEQMAVMIQDIIQQVVKTAEEKTGTELKLNKHYIWQLKKWLLSEEE